MNPSIKSILVPELNVVERFAADGTASIMLCHHRGSNECPTTYGEEQCAISIEASKTMIICREAFINRYSSRYQHEPCIRASDQWHKSSFTLLRPFTHLQSTESSKSTKQTRDPYTTTNKKAISSAHRPLHTMRQPGTSCQSTVATSSHLRTPHASASLTVPTDPPLSDFSPSGISPWSV